MAITMCISVCSIFKVSCYSYNKAVTVSVQKNEKMSVPYNLKEGQFRIFHELSSSGLKMEVIVQKKKKNESRNPPLVFVHGSYHAGWCWAQHWLPFFSYYGFDCYALSLLGQVLLSLSLSKLLLSLLCFIKSLFRVTSMLEKCVIWSPMDRCLKIVQNLTMCLEIKCVQRSLTHLSRYWAPYKWDGLYI